MTTYKLLFCFFSLLLMLITIYTEACLGVLFHDDLYDLRMAIANNNLDRIQHAHTLLSVTASLILIINIIVIITEPDVNLIKYLCLPVIVLNVVFIVWSTLVVNKLISEVLPDTTLLNLIKSYLLFPILVSTIPSFVYSGLIALIYKYKPLFLRHKV